MTINFSEYMIQVNQTASRIHRAAKELRKRRINRARLVAESGSPEIVEIPAPQTWGESLRIAHLEVRAENEIVACLTVDQVIDRQREIDENRREFDELSRAMDEFYSRSEYSYY